MKFFKNNKGAIILYLVIMFASLFLINDVKKDNERENSFYVMATRN